MWNHEVLTICMQNYLPNHSLVLLHEGRQKLSKKIIVINNN